MGLFSKEKTPTSQKADNQERFLVNYPVSISDQIKNISEEFKSLDNDIKRTDWKLRIDVTGDVIEHEYDVKVLLGVMDKFGPASAAVDKYHDYILGPGFYAMTGDERADKILATYNAELSMYDLFSDALKKALGTGRAVVEISWEDSGKGKIPNGFKVIPPDTVWLRKDKKGKIIGAVQDLGENKEAIVLDIENLVIFTVNKGKGILQSAMHIINDMIGDSRDMHQILRRKANEPIVAYMGAELKEEGSVEPSPAAVAAMGKELEVLNNKTEFATSYLNKFDTIKTGDVGSKFSFVVEYDWEMFCATVQIPQVLMGRGNIAEGLGDVQMDGFQRSVKSKQEELEKPMEEGIYRKILDANGFTDLRAEVVWGLPSELEKNKKLGAYTELLNNVMLSPQLRLALELEVADVLDIDLPEPPQIERKKEEEQPTPKVPGQNRKESAHTHNESCMCSESIDYDVELANDYTIEAWLGFNYSDYLGDVLNTVEKDSFKLLMAKTAEQVEAGLFTASEIDKLKFTLKKGFKGGWSMKKISQELGKNIKLRDRLALNEKGKLLLNKEGEPILRMSAKYRAMMITRTEVTRAANNGALDNYRKNGIEQVRWVASAGERTCPFCESMNNTILPLNEADDMVPAHGMCRCTLVAVSRLD